MKIGDTIWEHRGYLKWLLVEIIGETSRSWLVPPSWKPSKVPKRGPHPGYAFTEQEADDWRWSHDYAWKISDAVRRCQDAAKLRQIAEIVSWKPKVQP